MIICLVICGLLSIVSIVFSLHCSIVFQKFNNGIKDWAVSLDDNTRRAINVAARNILREMDEKISSIDEENNDLNNLENE